MKEKTFYENTGVMTKFLKASVSEQALSSGELAVKRELRERPEEILSE